MTVLAELSLAARTMRRARCARSDSHLPSTRGGRLVPARLLRVAPNANSLPC
jgi:hypothetical protein